MTLQTICPSTIRPGSEILFVGESPGREECVAREGFVGPAGRVLQRAAKLAGLEWSQVSLSNVVKRPPSYGFSSDYFKNTFYETQEIPIITKTGKISKKTRRVTSPTTEYQEWVQDLQRDVQTLSPNVVVAVGSEALKVLCRLDQIHCWRGSVIESTLVPGQKVIPIVHPSYIQRGQWSDFWPMVYDLKKVKREAVFSEIRREPWDGRVLQDIEEIEATLGNITGRWSLDIETRGGSIACIGIGYTAAVPPREHGSPKWLGICIPLQTTRGPAFSLESEQQMWIFLDRLFRRNPLLVGQNLTYDLDYFKDYDIRPSGILMDTMTAHCFLYPEWTQGYKGLDFITSFYLDDVPYYKDQGKTWGSRTPEEDLYQYNLKDAVHTLRASYPIEAQLKARNLWTGYQEEILPLTYLALEMQERRLPINESTMELLGRLVQEETNLVGTSLSTICGQEINTSSSKQVRDLLYTTLHLPERHHKGTGKVTVEENALRELRTYYQNPVLDLIIKDRHLRKRKESFLDIELEAPYENL